jgi:single-stranded-DNA-specific exonuclease
VSALQRELGCSRLVAHLLTQRGIADAREAERFLDPSFEHLADALLLPDAIPAIRRLTQALDRKELIYVHGDYDGDGITAAALWTRLLEQLNGNVLVHVPHRRNDGYDFRSKFVDVAREAGARLIVTADCGIQRLDEVEAARRAGIDVIITDHHEVGPELPNAVAVVDPHRNDSRYPFKDLAAVGVAFRLGEALVNYLKLPVAKYRTAYSELAAIGTVTDIMPLIGENRVLVRIGLAHLSATRRVGLRALITRAGLAGSRTISSHQVGFVLGPRLNAVGRVADPRAALDLLLTRDSLRAQELAEELETANQERREEEARILEQAEARLGDLDMSATTALVLDDPNWHPGVIGVVANRLSERHCRPTLLVATDHETGMGRGSGRSVASFDLHAALIECGDLLTEFGGHAYAAGFSVELSALPEFRERFTRIAAERLRPTDIQPALEVDGALAPHEATRELLDELSMLEPWGQANEEPLLIALGVEVRDVRTMGRERQHLKLKIGQPGSEAVEAVLWNAAGNGIEIECGDVLDVCYRPQIHAYNGRESIRLCIEDVRASGDGHVSAR